MSELSVLAFVALPFFGLLVRSIIEIGTRDDLDIARRIAWFALVVLVPVVGLATYVIACPPKGAQLSGRSAENLRAEALVRLAERRQRSELSDADYRAELAAIATVD